MIASQRETLIPAAGCPDKAMANTCTFIDCKKTLPRADHYLCRDHWDGMTDGKVDKCPGCERFKPVGYKLCRECEKQRKPKKETSADQPSQTRVSESRPVYDPAAPDPLTRKDSETKVFYVYVGRLELESNEYYVGQTNDLKARIEEHRMGKTPSTKGKNFRLVWFTRVRTRVEAKEYEQYLQRLKKHNERQITRMVIEFRELIRLVYDPDKSGS